MVLEGPDSESVGHRCLPHPADVILQAWAPTPEACLTEAVRALVGYFADTARARRRTTHVFRVADAPWEDLLVSVLEEVLFLLDTRGEIPLAASVLRAPRGELSVSFEMAGVDDDVDLIGSTPKGIARSGLEFGPVGDQWRCIVIVDV